MYAVFSWEHSACWLVIVKISIVQTCVYRRPADGKGFDGARPLVAENTTAFHQCCSQVPSAQNVRNFETTCCRHARNRKQQGDPSGAVTIVVADGAELSKRKRTDVNMPGCCQQMVSINATRPLKGCMELCSVSR